MNALDHQMFKSNAQFNSSFQARAAELDQHVEASARVPTYFELMCPVALRSCKRGHSTSVTNSVSIEMLARNAQQHPYALTMDQLPPAVHASGYIEADFEGPWGSSSPKQRLKVVWRRFIPVYIIVLGVYFATAYVFFKYASPCRPISPTAIYICKPRTFGLAHVPSLPLLMCPPDMWFTTTMGTSSR